MNKELKNALGLSSVNQVGFVVKNLEEAIKLYEPLFGQSYVMNLPDLEWEYRGRQEKSSLKIALFMEGDVEIELIECVSGETPYKEFIEAGREGVQHIRCSVDDIEKTEEKAKEFGYSRVFFKRFEDAGVASMYLERENDPVMLELYEEKQA
ncbi:hypothetical protein HBA55_00270 [Pseudomaricurvus alkylphenolicus]|jgi:catechol 2,3-dioxygenase-like lactoylglutathione lyase family enzyme|uniref:VOC family protein n=1 Tax=Pseudomaricurvus alkylphenolicus TaxID=1306991 RepID=UPI00141E143E|nr:VOC family protein [Pseudomaricurvus alkylphenolicus]NIB37993.1 hypothetical protein [Pseudomaricurvus alkylphenolicus]